MREVRSRREGGRERMARDRYKGREYVREKDRAEGGE